MEFNLLEVTLEPGDTLLAFTDGITEARDSEGNFFGEERLLALIKDQSGSAKKLLTARIGPAAAPQVQGGALNRFAGWLRENL